MKFFGLFTGGKDSTMAVIEALDGGKKVDTLVTFISANPYSYMFHTINVRWTYLQAVSMGMRHIIFRTEGIKEKELTDLKKAFQILYKEGYEGVVVGAIASEYQRKRVLKIAEEVGLTVYTPLWGEEQEELLYRYLRDAGMKYMIVSVSAWGLAEEHLGWVIDDEKDVEELLRLSRKYSFNPTGEGGEYETYVLDAKTFSNPIKILEIEKKWLGDSGYLIIKKADLENMREENNS